MTPTLFLAAAAWLAAAAAGVLPAVLGSGGSGATAAVVAGLGLVGAVTWRFLGVLAETAGAVPQIPAGLRERLSATEKQANWAAAQLAQWPAVAVTGAAGGLVAPSGNGAAAPSLPPPPAPAAHTGPGDDDIRARLGLAPGTPVTPQMRAVLG